MRRRRLIALVLLVLLLAASVSYTNGYTLDIVDTEERAQTGYALYTHQGYSLNPVHPVSYNATRLTVVRSDDDGRLTIPGAFHVHWPFPLETHPKLWIEMIYVPHLHNAWGRIVQSSPASEVGIWQMTTRTRAMVFDLSVVDADLSQRPTWGMEIRRLYEGEVSNLADIEASLKR